jgi:hypothetical protein
MTFLEYMPRPINTKKVKLDHELLQLTELLAEHAHDVWAEQRLSEGWTWGTTRDDINKKHPDLVSYCQLPESEKVYDRQAALQTLKAIIALGYRIERSNADLYPTRF